jgi:hypothetical protein
VRTEQFHRKKEGDAGLGILDRDGQTVQCPDRFSARPSLVRGVGECEAKVVVQLGHDGVQLRGEPRSLPQGAAITSRAEMRSLRISCANFARSKNTGVRLV